MENVFRVFLSSSIDHSKHAIMLKYWPLKPDVNHPHEGGQTNTQIHTVLYTDEPKHYDH